MCKSGMDTHGTCRDVNGWMLEEMSGIAAPGICGRDVWMLGEMMEEINQQDAVRSRI